MKIEVTGEHIDLETWTDDETGEVCAFEQQYHPICRAVAEAADDPDLLDWLEVGLDRLFNHHPEAELRCVRLAPEVVDWDVHYTQWCTGAAHQAPGPITLELDREELRVAGLVSPSDALDAPTYVEEG